ncbi:MAG TPA: hypothetical protein PKA20_17385 [Burkholderiaceae bacterium]|nr:hypothetical protein [Burkholderiaceae bacterium]
MARPAVPFSRLVDSLGNIAREWRDFLVPSIADWSPAGNGITFAAASGTFVRRGQQVDVYADVMWPVTASGAAARIAGLPHPVGTVPAGLVIGFSDLGSPCTLLAVANGTYLELYSVAGAPLTNAALSGKHIALSGTYLL